MQNISCNYNNIQNQYTYNVKIKGNYLNHNNPTFKGHAYYEFVREGFTRKTLLIQETAFFRQFSGLKFIREYAEKTFQDRDKIRILDGACSTGEESWSLAMLFDNFPKMVEITGFDLGKKAIAKAKKGVFHIYKIEPKNPSITFETLRNGEAYKDLYLAFKSVNELSTQQALCQKLFNTFFDKVPPQKEKMLFKQRISRFILEKFALNIETKSYRVKPEKADVCNFIQGDIRKLDELVKDGDVDIFLFRNALYHLMTESLSASRRLLKTEKEAEQILGNVFESIYRKLSKNGIFVLGNDETLQALDCELIQKVLSEKGFIPIFKDNKNFASVWRKTSSDLK